MSENTPTVEPLWSNARIDGLVQQVYMFSSIHDIVTVAECITQMRDEYEGRIADGSSIKGWQPVPQSLEYDLISHAIKHGEMPEGYRVCQQAQA